MDRRIKSLCKRACRADRSAACELLRMHYKDVYAYLRRLCINQADAEDLTQQTFLKVWSSLDSIVLEVAASFRRGFTGSLTIRTSISSEETPEAISTVLTNGGTSV